MIKVKHLLIVAAIGILAILWFGSKSANDSYTVAIIGPLTGSASEYGIAQRNGVQLAIDEINSKGGIKGKPINPIFLDDQNDKIKAAEAARDAIYKFKAVAIIGAISSDNTFNIQRVCEKARVPMITAVSTNPFITRTSYKYSFRCLSDDNTQAEELAKYAYRVLNLRRVAVIHDSNRYGSEGARTYQRFAAKFGQAIVAVESYDTNDLNFRPQLERIKNTNPQGLLIWGLFQESALIVRQAREMGIMVPIMGGDGMALSSFVELAGIHAEGVILTYPFHPPKGGELAKTFIQNYSAKFNRDPDSFAAHAYDAMTLIAKAIENSDGTGPGIRNALAAMRKYQGVTGEGGFDEFGNETRPVLLARVQNGQFLPLTIGGQL